MQTPVLDLSNPDVVTKYRTAAEISNNALKAVAAACVPGALVLDLCKLGDNFINEAVQKTYSKAKGMSKGVAFPTCVSVNHCVCHNSPFEGDTSAISEGDTCKMYVSVALLLSPLGASSPSPPPRSTTPHTPR